MKKICFISLYPSNPSPMASIAKMIIEDLLETGRFDITLITYKEEKIPRKPKIKIYPILEKESISSIVNTIQIIKKEKFDTLHLLSTKFMHGRLFLFLPSLLKLFLNKPPKIIISAHEFYDYYTVRQFIVGGLYHIFLLRYSDLILVFNKKYPKMITSKWVYNKEKEDILFISKNVQSMRYEIIETSSKWKNQDIKPFILFFGFLRYEKGLPFLVLALKKVHRVYPNLKLIIAGGIGVGPGTHDYYLKVKEIITQLNLEESVIFTDFIPWGEVMELFNLAEIVVYPYLSIENSGALFIALYQGKAIIASNISGFRNVLTDKKNSLLVPPKKSTALANKILELLENKDLRSVLEKNAKKTYNRNSYKKLIKDYTRIFLKN